jgi:two-component system, OmpR family, phosphate regulon sensor histidine kinase PhoR
MTVAAQLRIAIALLVATLAAILLAAFYVPAQLQRSANEKYVEDAIPLRYYVQDLALQVARQQASVEAFLRTREPIRLERYTVAADAANGDLTQMKPLLGSHPRMFTLVRRATTQISELQGAFAQQIVAVQSGTGRSEAGRQADRALERFGTTSDQMIDETDAFVATAEREQRERYRQLLFVLGSLGVLALGIGVALLLLVPRRLGQLYEAEQQSRREAESRAEAARALAHVSDGVILTDAAGRVRFWNPAAVKLMGIDEDGAIGRELARLLPGWERLAQQPEGQSGFGGAAVLPIHLDRERWLSVMSVDFGDGVVYAVRDVTEERALETLRSDFVSTASHELRTPMTSISGAARTLLRHGEQLPPQRHHDFLEMIVAESDRLARIVDQILVASRIEAGKIDVSFERCDATGIARSVVDSAKHRAPSGIELHLDAPEALEVDCDPDRLRQILGNIVDNAIKYSPDGGDVRVELHGEDDTVRFVVQDEGMGFEPSAAEAIFDRFHRLDPQQTRGIGGTGLGLYIARELVRRMGGRIWAESERGRGAAFSFELPRVREEIPST